MFVYTTTDIIGILIVLIIILAWSSVRIRDWLKKRKCNHDEEVNETSACDAICRKCGKNLGFIGNYRSKP